MTTSIKSIFVILLLSFGCSSATEENHGNTTGNNTTNNGTAQMVILDIDAYDALLTQFVDVNGQVDYTSLKADDASLRTFIASIGASDISAMNNDEKLAFYINAYNAIVLLAVVDQYPTTSVMDIAGFFDTKKHRIAGKMNTLDELENQIIRPTFKEPRIHFALVCAAKSCPPLQQKAYRADTLEATFEEVTTAFIETQTTVDGKNVTTSKLFDWFKDDFIEGAGSVGEFLATYLPAEKATLEANDSVYIFTDYSWALNEQ